MHGDGDNPWQKQRWLNSSPPRSLTVFTSSPFKMWANSIWKSPDVLLSSPLFTSSSLRRLQFVGDFSSFHRNLLCSVYILAVGFTQEPADHHKPHNYLSFHLCFPSRLLKNSTPNPGNPTKFDLLSKLVWRVFILDQSATTLHKARENWTCKGVTLISHAFSFYVFTEFYFKTSRVE